ncbi:hypothetical protein D3C83_161750 [compost metagenome]
MVPMVMAAMAVVMFGVVIVVTTIPMTLAAAIPVAVAGDGRTGDCGRPDENRQRANGSQGDTTILQARIHQSRQ